MARKYAYLGKGILNAYSQVFFSDNPAFALLLILATFLVPFSGLAGMTGVLISILLAHWLGYDRYLISKGILSYNVLLVTLPIGLYFQPGLAMLLTLVFATLLTFFLTVAFQGWMGRYRLPFLSWPFLVGLWIVMLAVRSFSSLDLSMEPVYDLNRYFGWGGIGLVQGFEWLGRIPVPDVLQTWLSSLGAVFFQPSLAGGILVAAGLVISSRIAFLLSLIGFFSAWVFYQLLGLDINSLNYSYIGFNFILTAIAVGGFFLVPGLTSIVWVIILIPLVTFITVSMEGLFGVFQLSVYALPFNLVVPLFLFVLQFRKDPGSLREVLIQHNSPEKNLYAVANHQQRLGRATLWLFQLPFRGKWMVSQGHNGSFTHKAEWRHAWDFVKTDIDDKTFRDAGLRLTDYYCYDKPVCAAGPGVVDSVIDGIPDNAPGDANTRQNWGNTVILRHWEHLYSKYAHLKPGTIKVVPGQYVATGQELGSVGNSGRSPEPHLHFQFQKTPHIGSGTIDHPFGHYLTHHNGAPAWKSYDRPLENEVLSNPEVSSLLARAFHFIPGQKLRMEYLSDTISHSCEWEVVTDIQNKSFFSSEKSRSRAWFVNDGQVFYFTHYEGDRKDPLYLFFLAAFRVPLVVEEKMRITDHIPLFMSAIRWMRWFQDWVAPFYLFLDTRYEMVPISQDDELDPHLITLHSRTIRDLLREPLDELSCTLLIPKDGLFQITFKEKEKQRRVGSGAQLKCTER